MNYIINGYPRSGKDAFVDFVRQELKQYNINCHCISSVDKVKEAAYTLGWDGIKDKKGRTFLSTLKDISTDYYDGPMKYMGACISEGDVHFFMIREPKEIKKFVDEYPNTRTLFVVRDVEKNFDNHADCNVERYVYDHIIENNGSLDDFRNLAKEFVKNFILYKS